MYVNNITYICNMEAIKELREQFTGIGQVRGFEFTQVERSPYAYIYEVNTGVSIYYEVFKRKENTRYNCISYPSDKSFGMWAWTFHNKKDAESKMDLIDRVTEVALFKKELEAGINRDKNN